MKILAMMFLGVIILFGAVDINTANQKELSGLSGIGASKALAIIEYRNDNCFKSINELAKVKGIGSKTVDKNRENLRASKCNTK